MPISVGSKIARVRVPMSSRRPIPLILVAALYGVSAFALVWIALAGLPHSIISSAPAEKTDALSFLWNGWWMQHAIATHTNPYFCKLIFAPEGAPLVFHSFDLLQSALMAAVGTISSPSTGYNVVVALGFLLAGLGAYTLSRHVTHNDSASFIGGLTFMLSPFI